MTLPDDNSREALTAPEVKELRRLYLAYVAQNGWPTTWGLRSEVFEALIAAALAPCGFSAEDVAAVELARGAIQDAQVSKEDRQAIERLRSLASRIQSLLPPDSENAASREEG